MTEYIVLSAKQMEKWVHDLADLHSHIQHRTGAFSVLRDEAVSTTDVEKALVITDRITEMFADKFRTNTKTEVCPISMKYQIEITARKQRVLGDFEGYNTVVVAEGSATSQGGADGGQ